MRNDFTSFIERAFYELNPQTEFIPGAYIELLAALLEQVRRGECKRLIINIPPRTLKSHAASVAFPAWLLGHDPSKQILCASYGQDLADKLMRLAKQSIKFENGRVFLPSQAPWLEEYIREITGFPGAKHDDRVDSTSQALKNLKEKAKSVAFFERLSYLASLFRRHDDY